MLLAFLIAITAWLLGLLLPWWSLAIPCLILGGWLGERSGTAFMYGFLGIGGLWLVQVLFIDIANDGILSSRIAELFSLPHSSLVILLTVIIGGVAGGLCTLTGFFFKSAFLTDNSEWS